MFLKAFVMSCFSCCKFFGFFPYTVSFIAPQRYYWYYCLIIDKGISFVRFEDHGGLPMHG